MIVCHCENVNDRTIDAAIQGGASELEQVTAACRAGRQCGGCHESIEQLLDARTRHEQVTPVRLAVA